MWLLIREFIGWTIVVVGLVLIGFVVRLAFDRSVLEAMALSIPATVVFRSGIGLVRLSVAGRLASRIAADEP